MCYTYVGDDWLSFTKCLCTYFSQIGHCQEFTNLYTYKSVTLNDDLTVRYLYIEIPLILPTIPITNIIDVVSPLTVMYDD